MGEIILNMKDINFTFGIITNCSPVVFEQKRLQKIFDSILELKIPKYEVIVVGPKKPAESIIASYAGPALNLPLKWIDFNETSHKDWITRKKNLITNNASYNNIVYQHDYLYYDPAWYEAWKEFGEDYFACMNAIVNVDGTRYRDWSLFHSDHFKKAGQFSGVQPQECLLPYDETTLSRWMYFSGAYFVAKKKIMEEFPLNEKLGWGHGEDCEWSYLFRQKYPFSINAKSKVHMLKYNHPIFWEVRKDTLLKLKLYANMEDENRT